MYRFRGGRLGAWRVRAMTTLQGEPLASVEGIDMAAEAGAADPAEDGRSWILRGVVSNLRYAERREVGALRAAQPDLARPEATRAALIPIRKSSAWWALAQDERRAIFEEQSHHTRIGMEYLPAVARRLHHCRDLGEPFDFLTWFEFAPRHEVDFDAMLERLRRSEEWRYVEREVDIRCTFAASA